MSLLELFNKKQMQSRPKVRPGDLVRVYQKDPVKEGGKPQIFEGIVIARRHGFGATASITVRRESGDVAVEKTYPLHSPVIEKLEIVQRSQVRRAKLYYLRHTTGKKARLKRKQFDLDQIEYTEAGTPAPEKAEKPQESTETKTEQSKESAGSTEESIEPAEKSTEPEKK